MVVLPRAFALCLSVSLGFLGCSEQRPSMSAGTGSTTGVGGGATGATAPSGNSAGTAALAGSASSSGGAAAGNGGDAGGTTSPVESDFVPLDSIVFGDA